ncbi:unnamed protein product [Rhizophagus irregularis]|nr:unnamed protein product [Rhizophagus irregularis]
MKNLIKYNDDDTVNMPFSHVAECCVESAVDYIEWNTKKGSAKSTNRIDDIIKLTPEGDEYVRQIEAGEKKEKICWYWVMYYSGKGNSCQHECRRIGSCKENCANYSLSNNIKNYYDMHLCKVV